MSVNLRILQRFGVQHEKEFLELERLFIALEQRDPNFPQGRRSRPISGAQPLHTLIWECEFPGLDAARQALDFMANHPAHEELFAQQARFIEEVRIEFYEIFP